MAWPSGASRMRSDMATEGSRSLGKGEDSGEGEWNVKLSKELEYARRGQDESNNRKTWGYIYRHIHK